MADSGGGDEAPAGGSRCDRGAMVGTRIPGVLPVLYAVMGRSARARQRIGTVAVTAVGMFAGGGSFGIAPRR